MKFLSLFRTTLSTRHFFLLQTPPQKWRIYAQCSLSKFKKRYACTAHVRLGIQNRYSDWPWDRSTEAFNTFTNTKHSTWSLWFPAASVFCADAVPTTICLTVGYITSTSRRLLLNYSNTPHLFSKTKAKFAMVWVSPHRIYIYISQDIWKSRTAGLLPKMRARPGHGDLSKIFHIVSIPQQTTSYITTKVFCYRNTCLSACLSPTYQGSPGLLLRCKCLITTFTPIRLISLATISAVPTLLCVPAWHVVCIEATWWPALKWLTIEASAFLLEYHKLAPYVLPDFFKIVKEYTCGTHISRTAVRLPIINCCICWLTPEYISHIFRVGARHVLQYIVRRAGTCGMYCNSCTSAPSWRSRTSEE